MVYAVAPGADWGTDWVKIGAHQSSSMEVAVKELRARYGTGYPEMRFLHLCFTATHKIDAEKVVKQALSAFRRSGEVYRGLGAGLESALQAVYEALEVPLDSAYEHQLSPAKRALLEAVDDVVAVKRARHDRRVQKEASRAAEKEARLQAERDAMAAMVREAEAASQRREQRRLQEEAKLSALDGGDVAHWVEERLEYGKERVLTLKDAHQDYRAHGGKLGKIKFGPRLKQLLAVPFFEHTTRDNVNLKNFWEGVAPVRE